MVDVERYEDGTAGLALVVDPFRRDQGLGKGIVQAVSLRPELTGIEELQAGVEPENLASVGCLEGAGFVQESEGPDEEGFIYFARNIRWETSGTSPERREKIKDFDPLVNTGWLGENLENPGIRVVDIRGYVRKTDLGGGHQRAEYVGAREEYEEAHIPGAAYVDWTRDIVDPENPVPAQVAPPERFAALMESLGIGNDTHVVAYDHLGGQFATRLWWALTYYGHEKVSVLNGGWKKWTSEDRPVTDEVPGPRPARFDPAVKPEWRAEAGEVLAAGEDEETLVLDARDRSQYAGEVSRDEGRAGHVPGAKHLHADSLFDPEDGTFLPDKELEEKLREAGVSEGRDEPVIAYCNGGVAATVPLFAMHRLGYRNLSNYDGSWNEWGTREDLPVE